MTKSTWSGTSPLAHARSYANALTRADRRMRMANALMNADPWMSIVFHSQKLAGARGVVQCVGVSARQMASTLHPMRFGFPLTFREWLLLFLLIGGVNSVLAATPRPPDGRRLFQKHCASCHGAKGEGVKDKYADPLTGDWSVAKLARYVGANMPEDNPESLSATEAEAVSRYVYDAFYSRAAQARLNPARVELAHLTNQQYLITVADLLRGLGEPDPAETSGPGLNGVYYSTAQRGRFDASKIVHRGVDRTLDFILEEGSSLQEKLGPLTQFSMQWRGAVLADETGDYEFVVR